MKRERLRDQEDLLIVESRKKLKGFRSLLKIDPHDLDEELIQMPTLFSQVADEFALCISRKDEAKAIEDRTEARVQREIREQAEADEEKLSETRVKALVLEDDEVVAARAQRIAWTELVNRWEGLRDSYKQRSYSLNHLVSLFLANYYIESSGGMERNKARDRVHMENRDRMAAERKRRM